MNSDRWQQVKELLAQSLEVEKSRRITFLDQACAGDSSLRSELESLLAAGTGSDLLNDRAALPDFAGEVTKTARSQVNRRIGSYQIVEQIGTGGMGEVYRAFRADDVYRKQVAIKVVRAGFDSTFVVDRFKHERQVLATLDHPNIGRLIDGGTTDDDLPYFVMELIEGQPITDYCDNHSLNVDDRLQLFLQVCGAVQYAHQHLIVHRDLKPSNILVTSECIPKLLDFGIAKILNPTAIECPEPTLSMFRLFTPGYASPEQVKGETITTACDVYSLGVLLYELLTGCKPYRTTGLPPHEVAKAVCEFDPERPSSAVLQKGTDHAEENKPGSASLGAVREGSPAKLSRRLRGDLDNIILVALRKEPDRRYATAEQFASDIRRHLENLPVTASRDTLRYSVSKFVRRNKGAVSATVLIVLAVLTGVVTTLHEARVARQQQLRAEQRFNDVRELANSLMFDVHDSIQDLPGSTAARKLLVDRALRYLDRLSEEVSSDPSLQRELGTAYEKVGTVEGNPFGANLGDTQGALDSYERSLKIRESLASSKSPAIEDLLSVARSERLIAAVLSNRGDASCMERLERSVETAEHALQMEPNNPSILRELQSGYYLFAILSDAHGDYAAASDYLNHDLLITEKLAQASPSDRALQRELGRTELKLGYALARLGSRKEGLDHARRGLEIIGSLGSDTHDAESRRWLAMGYWMLGDIRLLDHDNRSAHRSYEEEYRIDQNLADADPSNAVIQYDYGCATARVGYADILVGRYREGVAMLNRAVTMFQSQLARDPSYIEPRFCLAGAHIWAGDAFVARNDTANALLSYRNALKVWEPLVVPHEGTGTEAVLASIHTKIGSALAKLGKRDDALKELQIALKIVEPITNAHPKILEAQYVLADTYFSLGNLAAIQKSDSSVSGKKQSCGEARGYYQRSLDVWHRIDLPGARTPVGFACGSPRQVADQLEKCNLTLANSSNADSRLSSRAGHP